jgi:hypothetical protein
MGKKRTASAEGGRDTTPEKLSTPEITPDALLQGIATIKLQSDSKDAEDSSAAHPIPPGPSETDERYRMLASAESLEEKKRWFNNELDKQRSASETEGRRAMFWGMEKESLRTQPRASVFGRYLHDNNVTQNLKVLRIFPAEVYEEIHRRAPQHLDSVAKNHLKSANSGARASYCSKGVAFRVKLLLATAFVTKDGKKYWLTSLGATVFNRWPWWSSRDDEREPHLDAEPLPPSPVVRKLS